MFTIEQTVHCVTVRASVSINQSILYTFSVCAIIPGADEETRLKRHIIARYLTLTAALSWREISGKVRRRFPTISHLVTVGLMTEEEEKLYNDVQVNIAAFATQSWTSAVCARISVWHRQVVPSTSMGPKNCARSAKSWRNPRTNSFFILQSTISIQEVLPWPILLRLGVHSTGLHTSSSSGHVWLLRLLSHWSSVPIDQ